MEVVYKTQQVEELQNYGELFAINFDGSAGKMVYGYRSGDVQTGSSIKKKKSIYGWGEILDTLPED